MYHSFLYYQLEVDYLKMFSEKNQIDFQTHQKIRRIPIQFVLS